MSDERSVVPPSPVTLRMSQDGDAMQGNFWEQVDSYLTKRSGLQFTHAICPTCRDREVAQFRDSHST